MRFFQLLMTFLILSDAAIAAWLAGLANLRGRRSDMTFLVLRDARIAAGLPLRAVRRGFGRRERRRHDEGQRGDAQDLGHLFGPPGDGARVPQIDGASNAPLRRRQRHKRASSAYPLHSGTQPHDN